jgi:2-methylcitrate dehydratase PrpD
VRDAVAVDPYRRGRVTGDAVETKIAENLARFAAEISFESLPQSTRAFTRNLLLDSIACALAGDYGDETAPYARFARAAGGTGEATVIGSPERLSLLGATLINGYLITTVTICDTYLPGQVHISPEIVPPALAVAERDGLGGKALLTAIAIGAEVATRIAAGIDYAGAGKRGWHFPGVVGPFGAAAAVGHLRGLSPLQMRNAFGLAGSQAAGTWASWGTPTVKFHQSRGAASGLLAGLLAEQDFAASAEILAHPDGGMFAAYSDGGKPDAIFADLGERFELEQIALRLWPGATPAQPALTAAFELVAGDMPPFDAIERVLIDVPPNVYDAHARFVAPVGKFEALLSYHFMVAKILRDRTFWLNSLEPEEVDNPDLRRFMRERIELAADPTLSYGRSRITVMASGGKKTSVQIDAAKGAPGNPATADDLRAKFDLCVAGRLGKTDAAELLELLERIDQVGDLSRLFTLLASAGERMH